MMKNKDRIVRYCIYIVSLIGFAVCIATLFPQVRHIIIELAERILQRKTSLYQEWSKTLLSYATGGIVLIALLNYCLLTVSGKTLVSKVKDEIRDCMAEIDWRSFVRPALLMFGIYLLGILSIIRANFLYLDDVGRTAAGYRGWYDWSRYVSEFFSIFVHADIRLTDISPLPQLLAAAILAVGSVLLVYVLCSKKITIVRLFASIPVGLSPYMLECLSYKYDSPHMALSVLASIVPFLFAERKKAFLFCSVISLLVMCMTYQAASGIYLLIALVLCFSDWNGKRKTNREVFLFLGRAALSFCLGMVIFKAFLMKPYSTYVSNEMLSPDKLIPGIVFHLQKYVLTLNNDLSVVWKAGIALVLLFFFAKSVCLSKQNKIRSFCVSFLLVCLLLVVSYGVYPALKNPLFSPRALYGFGVWLAVMGIYVVSSYRKTAIFIVLALNWSFLVFAFSYGNALADQMRYVNFRVSILLHDLSNLYPDKEDGKLNIQLKDSIGFTPTVRNIAKHNPVICRLVPRMLMESEPWANFYYLEYFNYAPFGIANLELNMRNGKPYVDFDTLDLPVIKESYYHTIRSDGNRVLVELKEREE